MYVFVYLSTHDSETNIRSVSNSLKRIQGFHPPASRFRADQLLWAKVELEAHRKKGPCLVGFF